MKHNSQLKLGKVVLNVKDLDKQIEFYTEKIGLFAKNITETSVDLVVKETGEEILKLEKVIDASPLATGLYHIAILVPSRQDLANVFNHLLEEGVALQGGSDHGYSEALYLADPEGNGIEIYADKDVSVWDYKEDGRIVGVTEPLAAEELLSLAKSFSFLVAGTTVGHVHLSSNDALLASENYQSSFYLLDKFTMPTGSWIASGDYHHHLAFNHWGPQKLTRKVDTTGLAEFTIFYETEQLYAAVFNNIKDNDYFKIVTTNSDEFLVEDVEGIRVRVSYIKK